MKIAERLKEIRKEKNISQGQLAKGIGVDVSSISYWESGTYEPKATYIYKMALFLNVSADYLLGIEDETGRRIYNISNTIHDNHGTIRQTIRR